MKTQALLFVFSLHSHTSVRGDDPIVSGGGRRLSVRSAMDGPKSKKRTEAAAAADGFPDDPLVEILSRLPAKPLFRFKCVSEGWCRLITDRLGLRKFPQTLEGFFVSNGGGWGGGVNDWRFINLSGKSVPLVDASFSFLTKLPGIKQIKPLGAHNGLVLFGCFLDCGGYEYIVCNPATEQWMRVPCPGTTPHPLIKLTEEQCLTDVKNFLVFYPAVSSHFHLLQFWYWVISKSLQSVHIFSSETGVWRDSTREWREWGAPLAFGKVPSKVGCADVNGMLHVPVYLPLSQIHQIAVVDTQGKRSTAIHWPDKNEFHGAAVFIGQSQGHLHCITAHKNQEGHITGLSIWVLEDYDAGQWVLKQSVSCSKLFGEMTCGVDGLDVITIHPDRNLVFFVHRSSLKLMSYDMDSEEVCYLCTLAHDCGLVIPYVPYFANAPVLSGRPLTDILEGMSTGSRRCFLLGSRY